MYNEIKSLDNLSDVGFKGVSSEKSSDCHDYNNLKERIEQRLKNKIDLDYIN